MGWSAASRRGTRSLVNAACLFPTPRPHRMHALSAILFLLMLAVATGCASAKEQAESPVVVVNVSGSDEDARMTQSALQSTLMGFADTYASIYGEALLEFEKKATLSPGLDSPLLLASEDRLASFASAFDIAAGPNPGASLLDMVVMVSLQRVVWETHWAKVYGDSTADIVTALKRLEQDIWSIAARVLNSEQQSELRNLIANWRSENSDSTASAYIRLSNFADTRRVSQLRNAVKPGGLLAPIKEATQAADELRLLGERVAYLFSRQQILVNFQVSYAYQSIVNQAEVRRLLSNTDQFSQQAERFVTATEQLPAALSKERTAAIRQLLGGVRRERQATFDLILDEEQRIRGTLNDLHKTILAADQLVAHLTGARAGDVEGKRYTLDDYRNTIIEVSAAAKQLEGLSVSMEKLVASPGWGTGLPQIVEATNRFEQTAENWLTHAFLLAAALLILFFALLLGYRFIVYRSWGSI